MALAILPLFLLFIFFQWKSLKLPRQRFGQMCVGILYTYVGLVVFLLGVSVAFSSVGYYLGQELAAREEPLLLLGLGLLLGAVIVFAEPSVWVLTRTVEEATDASVSRGLLLTCLASAVAVGVALSFARAYWDFSLIYLIVPAYVLAFALMPFTPDPFTGIAFDSGGVASGVLAATFIMPLALGVGESRLLGQASQAFGSVAMIAVAPLICIQLMGLYYRVQQRRIQSLPPGLSQMPEEQLSAGQPGWEQELADFYHCFRQAGDGQTRGGN